MGFLSDFQLGLAGVEDVVAGAANTYLGTSFGTTHAANVYADQTAEDEGLDSEQEAQVFAGASAIEGTNASGLGPAIDQTIYDAYVPTFGMLTGGATVGNEVGKQLSASAPFKSALSGAKWILAAAAAALVGAATLKIARVLR